MTVRSNSNVFAVSGVKNSGKTTLICELVRELSSRGLNVGVIKHEGHEFDPDVPGTDSYKIRHSGAASVAVFSENRSMVIKENSGATEKEIIKNFPESDIILLEGFKFSHYYKVEVFRIDNSDAPVCDPDTMFALVTDCPADKLPAKYADIPLLGLSDYPALADIICRIAQSD